MRALAAFLVFAAVATPALAQTMPSATGFFIQAYGGLRIPDNLQFDGTAQDLGIGTTLGGSVGVDSSIPGLTGEIDYMRSSTTYSALGTSLDSQSLMLDGIYNLDLNMMGIKPYVGAGLGAVNVTYKSSDSGTALGYQLKAGVSGPSRFLFATEDGVIAGWAPNVDGTHAIVAVDHSMQDGAIYKALALSAGGNGQLLYATDFHNAKVDVFDGSFQPATLPAGAFADSGLPAGFAPFGIQAIGGDIYVTYAKQDADGEDEIAGPGLGYVDVYGPDGRLLYRLASRGNLNAPWGVALAPAGFGHLGNTVLIANFGDGRINAYEPVLHIPAGTLMGRNHRPIQIDGLWGIAFGNGSAMQPVDTLFFAAGPADEAHGLYGRLDVMPRMIP